MKLFAAYSTSDPYEPRSMDGIFTSIEKAKEFLPTKYLWMRTDKCKHEDEYENLKTGEIKMMDHSFGPRNFLDEIEADKFYNQ